MGVSRAILGVGYPRNVEQIQRILEQARCLGISLYPISRGMNIGYGEMTPTTDQQLVLNLSRMCAIREFDAENGEIVIEPGVSQKLLSEFLEAQKANYIADMTGASPDASVVGNILEAGFGHTPIGNRRKHVVSMEVVLADGTVLKTSEMPSLGPDLAQLFIQSNFGIVTAIRMPLLPCPETIETFTLSFKSEEKFLLGIERLRELRRNGTLVNLVHVANATRTLMTSSRFPETLDRSHVLSQSEARAILNSRSLVDYGEWTALGALSGFRDEVACRRKRVKKAMRGVATVRFFSTKFLNGLIRVLSHGFFKSIRRLSMVLSSLKSLRELNGIVRGVPSEEPSRNILWRIDDPKRLGLLWYAPVVPATSQDVASLLKVSREVFEKHKFEMPLTLTLISSNKMTGVFSFSFDRLDPEQVRRAHEAYAELSRKTIELGYRPYRAGLLTKFGEVYSPETEDVLNRIKRALDAADTVAPGRYGLSSHR
ncbi:MAG: FAD-binding oxidoreductase [Bdellovibrionales bacterium]|nr:FAD-binding oxidoreductase [Bdellovibrionales bacterium]